MSNWKDNDSYIFPKGSRFTLVFFDNETFESMEDDIIHANTRNFRVGVAYNCRGLQNCSIQEEDKIKGRSYFLNFYYKGFTLDHQDPEIPLKRSDEFTLKKLNFLKIQT